MINAILAVMTVAASMGTEPPVMVKSFDKPAQCREVANKLNQTERVALQEAGAGYVCLIIKYPTI